MLVEFSNSTATFLKTELPKIGQLFQSNEGENTLDLGRIKQLKGCRTGLIRNCLKLIQELDTLANINFINNDEKENHLIESRRSLVEGLKKYLSSCERYPRTKDFLNIIPDNVTGMVCFTIIASTFSAILSPPLSIIPVSVLIWVLIDFFFNNREAAKNLRETLFTAEGELRTIKEAYHIFKRSMQMPSETEETSLLARPSTSRDYNSFTETNLSSYRFFNAAVHTDDTNSINADSSSLTLT